MLVSHPRSLTECGDRIQQCGRHAWVKLLVGRVEQVGFAAVRVGQLRYPVGGGDVAAVIDSGTTWRREVNLGGAARLATLHFDS